MPGTSPDPGRISVSSGGDQIIFIDREILFRHSSELATTGTRVTSVNGKLNTVINTLRRLPRAVVPNADRVADGLVKATVSLREIARSLDDEAEAVTDFVGRAMALERRHLAFLNAIQQQILFGGFGVDPKAVVAESTETLTVQAGVGPEAKVKVMSFDISVGGAVTADVQVTYHVVELADGTVYVTATNGMGMGGEGQLGPAADFAPWGASGDGRFGGGLGTTYVTTVDRLPELVQWLARGPIDRLTDRTPPATVVATTQMIEAGLDLDLSFTNANPSGWGGATSAQITLTTVEKTHDGLPKGTTVITASTSRAITRDVQAALGLPTVSIGAQIIHTITITKDPHGRVIRVETADTVAGAAGVGGEHENADKKHHGSASATAQRLSTTIHRLDSSGNPAARQAIAAAVQRADGGQKELIEELNTVARKFGVRVDDVEATTTGGSIGGGFHLGVGIDIDADVENVHPTSPGEIHLPTDPR